MDINRPMSLEDMEKLAERVSRIEEELGLDLPPVPWWKRWQLWGSVGLIIFFVVFENYESALEVLIMIISSFFG